MTSLQQRAELHRQFWAIANDVRGSVDGWDFKQYVLGALFYRFINPVTIFLSTQNGSEGAAAPSEPYNGGVTEL